MKMLRSFLRVFCVCFVFSNCLAAQGVVVLNSSSKELKRTAHRMRIPVDQLKHARETLQEATDLAKKIQPRPTEHYFNLAQGWVNLDKSRSAAMIESLIDDLRSEAADCSDASCYQKLTSVGMMMMQTNQETDYEKMIQLMRNWPLPKESAGEAAKSFKESMEAQVKRQSLMKLASSDPEKALSVLPQIGDTPSADYWSSAQIAQGLMNQGKREESLRLIDKAIQGFEWNTKEARVISDYENFVRMVMGNLDSTRATNAVMGLVTAMMNQSASDTCTATMKTADSAVDLTCTESRVLNFIRGYPVRPVLTQKLLDLVPALRSKLDAVGGLDNLFGGYGPGGPNVNISYNSAAGQGSIGGGKTGVQAPDNHAPQNIPKLIQDLKGKDTAYMNSRLKSLETDVLVSLAMSASYQDPDLGAAALELARQLLPQVEPLQKRMGLFQTMVQAYRQVDGEVDASFLKSGFILADDLRQETESAELPGKNTRAMANAIMPADQLEASLVAELSKTSYDSALTYARSLENSALKLNCLLQIVQALGQPNF